MAPSTLRGRVAAHLGWTIEQTETFSFLTLRALVTDPELREALTEENRRFPGGGRIRG